MIFKLNINIDDWNEYKIHYKEETYERLIIMLEALLTEFKQKQKQKEIENANSPKNLH